MSGFFGASTAFQSNPRLAAFTAGPTAPFAVNKILTSASDYYIGNWQGENIDGAGSNDILTGGGGMDYLDGNSGNDTVSGGEGHDALRGRAGNDYLLGGDGNDDLQDAGTAGADTLDGGAGSDEFLVDVGDKVIESLVDTGMDRITLRVSGAATYTMAEGVEFLQTSPVTDNAGQVLNGNSANNGIAAGNGNDSVYGHGGNDGLFGENGNDYLNGGAGNDWHEGGAGNDTAEGGIGDDIYVVENAGDVVIEQADQGWDEVRTDLSLFKLAANIEKLTYWGDSTFSAQGNDIGNAITGGMLADQIWGLGGNDTVEGGIGNDFIDGGAGADLIYGGLGRDMLVGGTENDLLYGGYENDSMIGGAGHDHVHGDEGNDTVSGDSGNDYVSGGAGNDNVWGGTGADTVLGGDGYDTINGGAGRDMLFGGMNSDLFVFASASDSTNAMRDTIGDFESIDILSLTQIDADTTQAGDQAFHWVEGGRPFFTSAGDLWREELRGGGWTLKGDVNGDGVEDLAINFTGYYAPTQYDIQF